VRGDSKDFVDVGGIHSRDPPPPEEDRDEQVPAGEGWGFLGATFPRRIEVPMPKMRLFSFLYSKQEEKVIRGHVPSPLDGMRIDFRVLEAVPAEEGFSSRLKSKRAIFQPSSPRTKMLPPYKRGGDVFYPFSSFVFLRVFGFFAP